MNGDDETQGPKNTLVVVRRRAWAELTCMRPNDERVATPPLSDATFRLTVWLGTRISYVDEGSPAALLQRMRQNSTSMGMPAQNLCKTTLTATNFKCTHDGALEMDADERLTTDDSRMTPDEYAAWIDRIRLRQLEKFTSAELASELARRGDAAVTLLSQFVQWTGDEPCTYDHNGFCQTHYQEKPCMVERARALCPTPVFKDPAPTTVDLFSHGFPFNDPPPGYHVNICGGDAWDWNLTVGDLDADGKVIDCYDLIEGCEPYDTRAEAVAACWTHYVVSQTNSTRSEKLR